MFDFDPNRLQHFDMHSFSFNFQMLKNVILLSGYL